MRKVTCILTFSDGKKVVATAEARTDQEPVRFNYGGDVSRLLPYGEKGTLGFFEWYLRGIAANYGANIDVASEGEFE